jgi:hypothetical protein
MRERRHEAPIIHLDVSHGLRAQTPQKILERAIKGERVAHEWKQITTSFTPVRTITANAAYYLGNVVPSVEGKGTLLGRCIRYAMEAWEATHGVVHEKYLGYLRGLLLAMPEALEWRVEMDFEGRRVGWNPLDSGVVAWWLRHGGSPEAVPRDRPYDSSFVALSPANFRTIVLVKFLTRGAIDMVALAPRLDDVVCRYG